MRRVKELISPCGKWKLNLFEREDGYLMFEEIYEDVDEDGVPYSAPGYKSGIFIDAAAAEAEMKAITPWLRCEG
jgi:hypothetical protein